MRGFFLSVLIMGAIIGAGYLSYQFLGSSAFPGAAISTFKNSSSDANPKSASPSVKLFFIKLEDDGASGKKIGCSDSVVGVSTSIADSDALLKGAFEALLSVPGGTSSTTGLYNALPAGLSVRDASIQNNTALINLSGKVSLGGVCDGPRIQAQLEETALSFVGVNSAAIVVNGVPLSKLLSEE